MAGCNATQIAAFLGISTDTLYNRCDTDLGVNFSAFAQEKRSKGDQLIHEKQYYKAVKDGNIQMLIHLGKHRLGQKDGLLEEGTKSNALVQVLLDEIMQLKEQMKKTQPTIESSDKDIPQA